MDLAVSLSTVFILAAEQLSCLVEQHPGRCPMYTRGGKWVFEGETWTNWCEGFLGGQLWLLYQHTRDPYWRGKAEHYSRLIDTAQDRPHRPRPGLPLLVHLEALV